MRGFASHSASMTLRHFSSNCKLFSYSLMMDSSAKGEAQLGCFCRPPSGQPCLECQTSPSKAPPHKRQIREESRYQSLDIYCSSGFIFLDPSLPVSLWSKRLRHKGRLSPTAPGATGAEMEGVRVPVAAGDSWHWHGYSWCQAHPAESKVICSLVFTFGVCAAQNVCVPSFNQHRTSPRTWEAWVQRWKRPVLALDEFTVYTSEPGSAKHRLQAIPRSPSIFLIFN